MVLGIEDAPPRVEEEPGSSSFHGGGEISRASACHTFEKTQAVPPISPALARPLPSVDLSCDHRTIRYSLLANV